MKKLNWTLALLLGLSLILAACGGSEATPAPGQAQPDVSQPDTAPEPTNTTAPTDTPEPTPTPTPEPVSMEDVELDTTALSASSNLNSYRSKMTITATGTQDGQEVQESLDFVTEYTKDPLVQHVVMSGIGFDSSEPGSVEIYSTADTMYLNMGDQWMSMPTGEDNQISETILTPDDLLSDTCGWKKEKDTELNGVKVEHYTTTKAQLEACSAVGLLSSIGELSDAGGDLYVAKDGNYVAQMDFFYEGTGLDLNLGGTDEAVQQGRMDIHFEMSDVNQPFTVQIPEEAIQAGALPEDIPIPPDAEEVSNMFGMITFLSASTPQQVADFYKAEMPNNGWAEVSTNEMSGMFMLEYSKDGRTANLIIQTDEDAGKTSVLITVEEGEG